ncbi:hypothetical protein GYMLUDRAFT_245095 [Collybiopsis luxurians FD-317 M1]|uniref:Uncharacterized protein n=1 Tax=Collybiopsis luxurians FD-317 M1 TaxID=944289 RepID=A0A0D0CMN2_9AGAR|nr:hypothetical protein GYMLUDRAFT_245095 [Collybiopsis luxurians FD-317 M1]
MASGASAVSFDEELALLESEKTLQYASWGTAAIMVWDVLIHIDDDVGLLSLPRSSRIPTIAYFISRFSYLGYSILQPFGNRSSPQSINASSPMFASVQDVQSKCRVSPIAVVLSTVSFIGAVFTLIQFFVRVRAFYPQNRLVPGIFGCLLVLATAGLSFLFVPIVGGPTVICNPTDFIYVVPVASAVTFDSCVFIAISYRIYQISMGFETYLVSRDGLSHHHSPRYQSLKLTLIALWGNNLPSLTRAILREGQFYYLISVILSVAALTLMLDHSLLPPYRLLLSIMYAPLVNITASRVFREVRLGRMREQDLSETGQFPSEVII